MNKGNKIFVALALIWCVFMGIFLYGNINKDKPQTPTIQRPVISQPIQLTPTPTPTPNNDPIVTLPEESFTETTEPSEETVPVETEPQKPTIEDVRTAAFEEVWHESAVYMAKTIWGEARGTSEDGQRKVGWCILNRVDNPRFSNTIIGVITAPNQFHGYSKNFPCTEEFYEMAMDIIANWQLEKMGGESNRNLDTDYLYFCADESGLGNNFRKEW